MTDKTDAILSRIETILQATLRAATSQAITEIRTDKRLRTIYELTGDSSVGEIAKRAKVSTGKVSGIWRSWEDKGLIAKVGKSYRKLVP